jgi:hypothetical protein
MYFDVDIPENFISLFSKLGVKYVSSKKALDKFINILFSPGELEKILGLYNSRNSISIH